MIAREPESPTADEPVRSHIAGILAALLPLLACFYGGGSLALISDGLLESFQEAGVVSYLIVMIAIVAAPALSVLLFFMAGRGTLIPVAIPIGIAAGPWLIGALGTFYGMNMVEGAIANADTSSRLLMLAVGTGEALGATAFGGWLSGVLLTSIALGLAVGARARRGPGRKGLFALVGVLALGTLAVPLIHFGDGVGVRLLPLAGLACTLTVALAASSIGEDSRSGAQATAAAFVALLAFFTTVSAYVAFSFHNGLSIGLRRDTAMGSLGISVALQGASAGASTHLVGSGLLAFVAILIAGISIKFARPSLGRWLGAIAAILLSLFVIGVDRLVFASIESTAEETTDRPWDGAEGFEPLELDVGDIRLPQALVQPHEIAPYAGGPLPTSAGPAELSQLLGALVSAPRWHPPNRFAGPDWSDEPIPEWLEEEVPAEEAGTISRERVVALAIDDRVAREVIDRLAEAARAADVEVLTLIGASGHSAEARQMLADSALLAALATPEVASFDVLLEPALPDGYADRDITLWHGSVTAEGPLRLEGRPGVEALEIRFESYRRDRPELGEDEPVVYLRLEEGASLARLAEAAHLVHEMGGQALWVSGSFPGHPETAAPPGTAAPIDDDSMQARVQVRVHVPTPPGPRNTSVRLGALEEESGAGVLDPAVVVRMVRARIRAIQTCYERALRDDPGVGGRVLVRFTIETSGAVTDVVATENATGSEAVASCATRTIRRFRFSPGAEGGSITLAFPFRFTPASP